MSDIWQTMQDCYLDHYYKRKCEVSGGICLEKFQYDQIQMFRSNNVLNVKESANLLH